MGRKIAEIIADVRKQYNNLIDEIESEGICVSRECMCDTAAPAVKLNAAIVELEQYREPEPEYTPEPEHHRMGL